jgi:hypothetical protein
MMSALGDILENVPRVIMAKHRLTAARLGLIEAIFRLIAPNLFLRFKLMLAQLHVAYDDQSARMNVMSA